MTMSDLGSATREHGQWRSRSWISELEHNHIGGPDGHPTGTSARLLERSVERWFGTTTPASGRSIYRATSTAPDDARLSRSGREPEWKRNQPQRWKVTVDDRATIRTIGLAVSESVIVVADSKRRAKAVARGDIRVIGSSIRRSCPARRSSVPQPPDIR
jgi:hypothetical protein